MSERISPVYFLATLPIDMLPRTHYYRIQNYSRSVMSCAFPYAFLLLFTSSQAAFYFTFLPYSQVLDFLVVVVTAQNPIVMLLCSAIHSILHSFEITVDG
jgi:hypothetical protein